MRMKIGCWLLYMNDSDSYKILSSVVVNIKIAVLWEGTCEMTAALKMMQIVKWNYMPDFYVCIMKINVFQIELFGLMKLL
jgi:hypothetical protein